MRPLWRKKVGVRRGWTPPSAAFLVGSMTCTILLYGCGKESNSPDKSAAVNTSVPVAVATVVKKTVPIEIRNFGTVEAYAVVTVKSQVAGIVKDLQFDEGQAVKSGQMLFTIDPRPFEVAVKKMEATLASDRYKAKDAQREANRIARLFDKRAAAEDERDAAKATADALDATVHADEAALENAKLQLSYCFICSPVDGRVGQKLLDVGNVVKENDTSMVVVNQIKPISVSFTVPQRYLSEIRMYSASASKQDKDLEVDAYIPGETEPERGALKFLDNAVDVSTGTIRLKGTFPNEMERLWPGQFVNVTLILSTRPDAVLVPTQAIQTGQVGQFVFVVRQDKTVQTRQVTVGPAIDRETVIEQGLSEGEMVVTDGQLRLVDGSKIDIKPDHPETPVRGATTTTSGEQRLNSNRSM